MKEIFILTKCEQRIVIVIALALVAGALAKYKWDMRSQPRSRRAEPAIVTAAEPSPSPRDEYERASETQ
jgi:hypothetical protein